MYAVAPPDPGLVSAVTKNRATWLATTYPAVQRDRPSTRRTAGCRRSGRNRMRTPARCSAGSRLIAIATTPAVVGTASQSRSEPAPWATASERGFGTRVVMTARATMTTRLLTTGAHAAAKNRRRALSSADARNVTP